MTLKLKDIPWLMVEKKKHNEGCCPTLPPYDARHCNCGARNHNQALDLMAERSLTMNRAKLAEVICDVRYGEDSFKRWKQIESPYAKNLIQISYEDADAIIAALPELIEVKHE